MPLLAGAIKGIWPNLDLCARTQMPHGLRSKPENAVGQAALSDDWFCVDVENGDIWKTSQRCALNAPIFTRK